MNLDRQKKLDAVAELLIRIQHEIFENPENWCAFLDMASRISDRSFEDQALIYAQFPAATAVADYVTWQDRGRYVRYGAQGIVLIDNKSDPARLRYVFDVANTRKKDRDYVPWEINPTNQTAVQDALRDAGADGDDISSQIIDIAAASVLNYWEEHQQALEDLVSEFVFSDVEKDEASVESLLEKVELTAANSCAYVLLRRCGFQPMKYLPAAYFETIVEYQREPKLRKLLGHAVQTCSAGVLRIIEKAITTDIERSANENDQRSNVQTGRRRAAPRPGATPDRTAREMGKTAQEVPVRESPDTFRGDVRGGDSAGASGGSGPNRGRDVQPPYGANEGGERNHGTAESPRSVEVGRTDEHDEGAGRGDHPARSDLRLNSTEQSVIAGFEAPAATISDEELAVILPALAPDQTANMRIAAFFASEHDRREKGAFLSTMYETSGYGLIINGRDIATLTDPDGLHVAEGKTAWGAAHTLPWEDVAEHIDHLLEAGKFIPQEQLDQADNAERKFLAGRICDMIRDSLSPELRPQLETLMPTLTSIATEAPPAVEKLITALADPSQQLVMQNEFRAFVEGNFARWRYNLSPAAILNRLESLTHHSRAFSAASEFTPAAVQSFVSDDAIDLELIDWQSASVRHKISEFVSAGHSAAENAGFVKHIYGTGGHSSMHDDADYNPKGMKIRIIGGAIPQAETQLSWIEVTKHIAALIEQGRYLTPQELAEYQEQSAASADTQQEIPVLDGSAVADYNEIKEAHPGSIVLYQVGDFFEMYGEDAKAAAPLLKLQLGTRHIADVGRVEFCGVPVHSAEKYVEQLRQEHDVILAPVDDQTSERRVYSMPKQSIEAPAAQDGETFFIYQLKDGTETRDLRFESFDRLQAAGHAVDRANYDLIYTAPLAPNTSLEDIYRIFNIDRPADFTGHSLSVSDIIVLHQDGVDTAYYVDSIGYREIPEFLREREQPAQETPTTTAPDAEQETEAAYRLENGNVLFIQATDSGYDYTLYGSPGVAILDGGQLDAPALSLLEARIEILAGMEGQGPVRETLNALQREAFVIFESYRDLTLQEKIDTIATTFGCTSGKIETAPCRGKWRGTSDMSIRFDNGMAFFIGNRRTPEAKTVKAQMECVNNTLLRYNPEIVQATKDAALPALLHLEAQDREVAMQKGLKPYTVLTVEMVDATNGAKSSGYLGWYYATLAVDGKICSHLETGLHYTIAGGKVDTARRRADYFIAGSLKESDVDYVFNNVGHSSAVALYSVPLPDTVRQRAEQALAKRIETALPDLSTLPITRKGNTMTIGTGEATHEVDIAVSAEEYTALEQAIPEKAELPQGMELHIDGWTAKIAGVDYSTGEVLLQGADRTEIATIPFVRKYVEAAETTEPLVDTELSKAMELIRNFCETEGSSMIDFSDLANVSLIYDSVTKDEIPIQVYVDLVHYRLERYLDGQFIERRQYGSLKDLIDNELEDLSFNELTHVSDEELESVGYFQDDPEEAEEIDEPQAEFHTETKAVYPAVENGLPYDVVVQTLSAPTRDPAREEAAPPADDATQKPVVLPAASEETAEGQRPVAVQVNGEWQTYPNQPAAEQAAYQEYRDNLRRNGENFRITDDHLGEGGPKAKYQANVAAIKLLKYLEETTGQATPEQQEVLSRYVGWGGVADAFDPAKADWANEYRELKHLLTPEEYAAARASTLNAHYTSPTVIHAVYEAVERMSFRTGNILEPSCGVGNFFGLLPESMAGSRLYGVELDSISGRIAQQLYPKADITVAGFETTDRRDFYDLAIGNVPFGQYQVNDKAYNKLGFNIHNYFFAKSLDQVRPGGVVAFVTSRYTMDAKDSTVRRYLAQRADLLGAIRLPNNTFLANAGTKVVSDIIFLQKRDQPVTLAALPSWTKVGQTEDGFFINQYFIEHPEMVLGKATAENTQYGRQDYTVSPIAGQDLTGLLHEAVQRLPESIYTATVPDRTESAQETDIPAAALPADPNASNYSFTVKDGTVYYREGSVMTIPEFKTQDKQVHARIKALIPLRDCMHELLEMQVNGYPTDDELAAKQTELNQLYDAFVEKFDRITSKRNEDAFSRDDSYYLLCSLEVLDEKQEFVEKAAFFRERTIQPAAVIDHAGSPTEALEISLAERGQVDFPYMGNLLDRDDYDVLAAELQGQIFHDPEAVDQEDTPSMGWVVADEYLSGNVRHKLRAARAAAAADPTFNLNVAALEKVQPKDLDATEIAARLGATWVPAKYITQFAHETFEANEYSRARFSVHYSPAINEWRIEHCHEDMINDIVATVRYGTPRLNAYEILERTLNLRDVVVHDYIDQPDGKKKAVLNPKATMLAQEKQRLIKEAFANWIWKDPDRRADLVQRYNNEMNNIRPREYDGSHLRFPGMSVAIQLKPHQRNAIAHILYGGNTLLAHAVGAGKTFEMAAAAMESKRLGLCTKSLFAVPNHIVNQFASDFLRLYPNAKLLVAQDQDFKAENRKRFCARIATGNYDAVIIGHSQFERIPLSNERQAEYLEQQISDITDAIAAAKADAGLSFAVKALERTRMNLTNSLEKLRATERKDSVVTFEQLGCDRLYVDEAHNYKNLHVYTKMRNIAGISTSAAQKSSDMYMKCQYMDEITGARGTVFATGTPVSNSMVELYTMQRYLQSSWLKHTGLSFFDAWAARFGETVLSMELAPEGTGYRLRNRFARFFNLPELMAAFRQCADIKTADQLHLPVPEAEYHVEVAQPTTTQTTLMEEISARAEEIHTGHVDPSEDNMLKITNDGRRLSLDQRLIDPSFPDEPTAKVNICIRNVLQIYQETAAERSTQLIFCDVSTPKADGTFNVYDDIKRKLIAAGVPANEIAFIHTAKDAKAKEAMFAKMRSGEIRILLGSTQKMGAGTNVQTRLIAMHDLDCPWKPGDLEQRAGRIVRQGNQHERVHIYRYVTAKTFDAYLWQIVENKQRFISQIMSSKTPVRECVDIDETALSYAEIKSLCAGDPKIKERMDLEVDVTRLKLLKADHDNNKFRLEDNIHIKYPAKIAEQTSLIAAIQKDIAIRDEQPLPSDDSTFITIRGVHYTDKADGSKALLDVLQDIPDGTQKPKLLGCYRGFSLYGKFGLFDLGRTLILAGNVRYPIDAGESAIGNIQRLDNAIDALEDRLHRAENMLQQYREQLAIAEKEVLMPFAYEQELAEKSARLAKLDAALNLDKDASDLDIEVSQEDEWLNFLENGGHLSDIPDENLTAALCAAAVEKSAYNFSFVPDRFKTPELCEMAVTLMPELFRDIPEALATPELAQKLFNMDKSAFTSLPDRVKTQEMCAEAVAYCANYLAFVPGQFKTKELCLSAFEAAPESIHNIPLEYLTEDMCLRALRQVALWSIPKPMRTFNVCCAAVVDEISSFYAVPNDMKTPAFYAAAYKAYGKAHEDATPLLSCIPASMQEEVKQLLQEGQDRSDHGSTLSSVDALAQSASARAEQRNGASVEHCPTYEKHDER